MNTLIPANLTVHEIKVADIKFADYNPRRLTTVQFEHLKTSLDRFGFVDPIIVNQHPDRLNVIVGGHQRVRTWQKMGGATVPAVFVNLPLEMEREINIRLNKNSGEWDWDALSNNFGKAELINWGFMEEELVGKLAIQNIDDKNNKKLTDKFIVPPFSILDARQGYWQDRKRQWQQTLNIRSELGRGENMLGFSQALNETLTLGGSYSRKKADKASNITAAPKLPEWADAGMENMAPGTSIFDPVLCEIAYRWFCPPHAKVLDPFAGGSVRGIIADHLGHDYVGIELRDEQIKANEAQVQGRETKIKWIEGDSLNVQSLAPGEYDFILGCPPYYDLEVYSDKPGELSAIETYEEFIIKYRKIINDCVAMLKPDRFALFVVGDIRDKKGAYRNFVSDTISAFIDAGMKLYNEAILITAGGTIALRAAKVFNSGRKLIKTHQNVLVFFKGDMSKIKGTFTELNPDDFIIETP